MPLSAEQKIFRYPTSLHEVLLRNVRGLVFVKDEEYRIVYANETFLNLYPPEKRSSVIGRTTVENFIPEEAKVFNAEDQKAFDTGFAEIVEEISDYTGRKFMFQTQKIRFLDENGEPRILGISTDITRLVERERLLAKSNVALENFAGVAAHDLRSPLAALYTSLDIMKNDKENVLGTKTKSHMQLMTTCLNGLIDQVAELLSTYKINEDKSPHQQCELSILFEEVKFNLSSYIQHAEAKVLSTELPRMRVNKHMFRQLIHNLIENSLKYRTEEKPIIILRYDIDKRNHCFSVEDNGLGVDSKNRDRIFDFSMQENQVGTGYGIGLSHCKKIVEMHNGKIWVDETYAPGTRICFTIPRYPHLNN